MAMAMARKAGDWAFKAFTAGLAFTSVYLAGTFSVNLYRGISWHNAQSFWKKYKLKQLNLDNLGRLRTVYECGCESEKLRTCLVSFCGMTRCSDSETELCIKEIPLDTCWVNCNFECGNSEGIK